MNKQLLTIALALFFVLAVPILGYLTIGLLPALIFLIGFLGGFIFWLMAPREASWSYIRFPYFITLALFLVHRVVEEHFFGFFDELTKITGVPYPDTVTFSGVAIGVLSLLWVLSPLLVKYGYSIGYYGAWSFFFAMGVSELAHFIFPFLTPGPYGYFPGMVSVLFLAPVAWWGMWRLWRGERESAATRAQTVDSQPQTAR
jgi:hypothetical protein